jgi:chemotaxis signal transduction protein
VVVPVDEVDGIHAIDARLLEAASRAGAQETNARFTRGVIAMERPQPAPGWMKNSCCRR